MLNTSLPEKTVPNTEGDCLVRSKWTWERGWTLISMTTLRSRLLGRPLMQAHVVEGERGWHIVEPQSSSRKTHCRMFLQRTSWVERDVRSCSAASGTHEPLRVDAASDPLETSGPASAPS